VYLSVWRPLLPAPLSPSSFSAATLVFRCLVTADDEILHEISMDSLDSEIPPFVDKSHCHQTAHDVWHVWAMQLGLQISSTWIHQRHEPTFDMSPCHVTAELCGSIPGIWRMSRCRGPGACWIPLSIQSVHEVQNLVPFPSVPHFSLKSAWVHGSHDIASCYPNPKFAVGLVPNWGLLVSLWHRDVASVAH
jgi:hypothetical protein